MKSESKRSKRFQLKSDNFDVVIIGAGTGGLTAGALLARRGKRVLIIDQHHTAGGNCTVFKRPGYSFDVGLHYLGGCGPDGTISRILRNIGIGEVRFNSLGPDPSDIFVFPDFSFSVPDGLDSFKQALLKRFPEESRGIERYVRFVYQLDQLGEMSREGLWTKLRVVSRSLLALRYLNRTLANLLDSCTQNEQLRAVLAGWQTCYSLPPSRVSAVANAGLCLHYLDGAFYPRGGGQVISDHLVETIESEGSSVLLSTQVRRILIEGGRVQGVEIDSPRLGRRVIRTSRVISNADIQHTMMELVGAEHLSRRQVRKTRNFQWPASIAVSYLGVERDLAAEGITGATYSIYPEYDVEPCYTATADGEMYPRPYISMTVPTLKDPGDPRHAPPGVHNMMLMAVAPAKPEHWGVTDEQFADGSYRKSEEYRRRKRRCGDVMLEQVEGLLPGLREDVVFSETSTPLTHRRYTNSSTGTGYGIASIPGQFLGSRPGSRTSVEGLYLAGASLETMHGIVGVMRSGLVAAGAVLGVDLADEVLSPTAPREAVCSEV